MLYWRQEAWSTKGAIPGCAHHVPIPIHETQGSSGDRRLIASVLLAPRKSFDILALYKSDYYYYY